MVKVPCIGSWNWDFQTRSQWGIISPLGPTVDKTLRKRIHWIAQCASVAAFYVITLDDWRSNDFKIFLEVTSRIEFYTLYGAWAWRSVPVEPHSCYYLGRFPWYWNYDNDTPVIPSSSMVGKILPWPYVQSVISGEYLPRNIYTDEDIILFYGKPALETMNKQQAFINKRKIARDSCLLKNYPKAPKPSQTTVTNEGLPMEWPGTPIAETTPPTPDAAPTPPEQAAPGVTIVKLTMYFGYNDPGRADGLKLTLEL